MIKEKCKFLRDCTVEAQGRVVKEFQAGEVYELPAASVRHWLRRNAAVMVYDKPDMRLVEQLAAAPEEVKVEPEPKKKAPVTRTPRKTKRGRPPKKAAEESPAAEEPEAVEEEAPSLVIDKDPEY